VKRKHFLFMLCYLYFGIFLFVYAQENNKEAKTGKIELNFYGFKNDKGMLKIALDNSKEGYENDKSYKYDHVKIENKKATYIFEDLPYGEYVVKVYHDANNNNKMETNFFGAPKEAYGFSNNARGKFGPPDYKDVKIILDQEVFVLEIEVK